MEQLTIFSEGGEAIRTDIFNSNELVNKYFKNKKIKEEESIIYQSNDVDNEIQSIVDNEDFFNEDNDGNFYVSVDFLKKNKNDEYKNIDISHIKHLHSGRHIPIDIYISVYKKGGSVDRDKISKVMGEFKRGKLYSSSGDLVTDRKQAIAIALSEANIERKENGGYIKNTTTNKFKEQEFNNIKDFELQHFYKYMETELKYFLKDTLGVQLNKDGVFYFNNQMYYIRPYIKHINNGKVLKEANLSIQNRGREVGEIIFTPEDYEPRFKANSEIFGWDNETFKAGGVAYSVPYNYNIKGIYSVEGKGIDTEIEIVGFERENDTDWSLYQPSSDRNEQILNLLVPYKKLKDISSGKTVFAITGKGDKVKIKRLGSYNDVLFS